MRSGSTRTSETETSRDDARTPTRTFRATMLLAIAEATRRNGGRAPSLVPRRPKHELAVAITYPCPTRAIGPSHRQIPKLGRRLITDGLRKPKGGTQP